MDFVQTVWQSFFSDLRAKPREFENVRHLRGFLAGLARNKVYQEHRRLSRTAKYALEREEPLYLRRGNKEIDRGLVSPEPSPSETFQATDRLAQLTARCNPRDVEIITLRHQGLTFEEIAARVGLNERSVRRVIDDARVRMEREDGNDSLGRAPAFGIADGLAIWRISSLLAVAGVPGRPR